jgi:hypothetical protein
MLCNMQQQMNTFGKKCIFKLDLIVNSQVFFSIYQSYFQQLYHKKVACYIVPPKWNVEHQFIYEAPLAMATMGTPCLQ